MLTNPTGRGARRRAFVRSALGKPGSLSRWVAGTAVWLFACLMASRYVGWLASIPVFLFAVLLAVTAFRARSLAIGDEDEFRAAVRRETMQLPGSSNSEADESRLDPEHWLSRGGRVFDGAPLPPSAENVDGVHSSDPERREAGGDAEEF